MKQLQDIVRESIFDIDDNDIVNKKGVQLNIKITQNTEHNLFRHGITRNDVNYFINQLYLCDSDKNHNVSFDIYKLYWNVFCFSRNFDSVAAWSITVYEDEHKYLYKQQEAAADITYNKYKNNVVCDNTNVNNEIYEWVIDKLKCVEKMRDTDKIIKKFYEIK